MLGFQQLDKHSAQHKCLLRDSAKVKNFSIPHKYVAYTNISACFRRHILFLKNALLRASCAIFHYINHHLRKERKKFT